MDYLIAIATYARHELIGKATLTALDKYGVDPDQIKIFVPNEEQLLDYRAELGNKYELVVAMPGQFKARQFYHRWISDKFGEGTKLIQMDDDIWGFLQVVDDDSQACGRNVAPYGGQFEDIARMGYGLAESFGTGLWGLSYMNNGFYLNHHVSVGNMLVCGGFQGVYAGDDIFIGERRTYSESAEEDGETSLQAFVKYGKVIRFQFLSIDVGSRVEPGGIRAEVQDKGYADNYKDAIHAREQTNEAAFDMLVDRYPGLVKTMRTKKGSYRLRYKNLGNVQVPREVVEKQFLEG